jgi:hypothetical protein
MRSICLLLASIRFFAVGVGFAISEEILKLDRTLLLPNIEIDGELARIHTQGLYVDVDYVYVTGRLEREPKRPLFVRFARANPNQFGVLDLSVRDDRVSNEQLDHPGGFDFDGHSFWIPVARSRPAAPSVIVRVCSDPTRPFTDWRQEIAFQVDDHVGAIAYEGTAETLYGANWDTKKIYVWARDGTQIQLIDRQQWIEGEPGWSLAVQDWKRADGSFLNLAGGLIAGGIDKSPSLKSADSRVVIEVYQPQSRRRTARVAIPAVPGYDGPLTREGMCLYERWLVLLPADIGDNATLYFFQRMASP